MALSIGTKLGPYEIQSLLGAGGMGEVYRARDTRLDRTVAIKILTQGLADTPEVRQRFEREARAVSSLSHPHICVLYDVGHQDGTEYLVMEYLEGETLAARIETRERNADEDRRETARFRFGEGRGNFARRSRRFPDHEPTAYRARNDSRHHAIHVAGTTGRQASRRAQRYFFLWRHPL